MAKLNATNLVLAVNGTAVAHQKEGTLNMNVDLIDVTDKDSDRFAENIVGLRDWSIDVAGNLDFTDTVGYETFVDAFINGTSLTVKWGLKSPVTGDIEFTGTVNLSGLTNEGPLEDAISWSGTLVGTGAIVKVVTV